MFEHVKIPEELRAFFLSAQEVVVEGNTHFPIDDPNAVYWVQGEGGDIFLYEPKESGFIPIFLIEVGKEELILPPPLNSYSLFFVSSRKTLLRKFSFSTLFEEMQKNRALLEAIAPLFDRWFITLSNMLSPPQKEVAVSRYFAPSKEVEVKKGEILALDRTLAPEEKSRTLFIEMKQGKLALCGESSCTFLTGEGTLYTFTFALWVEAVEDSHFKTIPTIEAVLAPGFLHSLHAFQTQVFVLLAQKRAQQLQTTLGRMQEKKQREQEEYREAFYKLGSVLSDKISVPSTYEGSPVFKAIDLIGQNLQIKIKAPAHTLQNTLDQVREICTSNGIYYRKVALLKNWWQEADQPILAFYGEEKHPVALLKHGRKYEVVDPVAHVTKPATEVAGALQREAFVFYEGFPKKLLRFRDFIFTAVKRNAHEGLVLLLVAIAGGLLNLFLPFAMKELFDTLTFGKDLNFLAQYTLGLMIVAFASAIFALTTNFANQRIEGLSKNQIETALWSRILELPASFFRKIASGKLMNHAAIFQTIRNNLLGSAATLLSNCFYCLFFLIQMFIFSGTLTLIGIAGMFLAFLIYAGCTIVSVRLTAKSFSLASTIQGLVVQIIAGIPKIRVAGAESRFFGLWSNLFSQKKKIDIKIQYTSAIQSLVFRLFPWLMTVVLFTTAITLFKDSIDTTKPPIISMATFFGFTTAFSLFYTAALQVLETIYSLSTSIPYWKRAKFIVEEPLEKQEKGVQTIKLKGGIALDHVYFRYEPESDWVLRDLSIVANPGEMIAIVGPSGCGKSTIVRLLLGFDTPSQGEVLYDEFSLKDLDLRTVRKQIGVVLQNAGILAGSIYDNIVGAGAYTVEEIERAVKLSGFETDLENFPMGLNTILPMGGGAISGGQRQRLYLARALVSSPKILILDEATSALDNRTQELVSANLEGIDVTRIVIAHRLSTIKHADRIYVIEAGAVVETGTFLELEGKGGLFAQMLRRQQV